LREGKKGKTGSSVSVGQDQGGSCGQENNSDAYRGTPTRAEKKKKKTEKTLELYFCAGEKESNEGKLQPDSPQEEL